MNKNIPENHRKLRGDEIIRDGDIYVLKRSPYTTDKVNHSIGLQTDNGSLYRWDFYRRLHKKAVKKVNQPTSPNKSMPVVLFYYHGTLRRVALTKMDETYLKGLEITYGDLHSKKKTYQFKTFRRDRMGIPIDTYGIGGIVLESFGPIE